MDDVFRAKAGGTAAGTTPTWMGRRGRRDWAGCGAARGAWLLFSAGVAISISTAAARAEQAESHVFLAAEQLLTLCDMSGYSPDNPSPAAMLYLMGIVDSEALAPARSLAPIFCLPDGTGQSTLAKVVCRYVQDHKESERYTAASLTYAALRSKFPCH